MFATLVDGSFSTRFILAFIHNRLTIIFFIIFLNILQFECLIFLLSSASPCSKHSLLRSRRWITKTIRKAAKLIDIIR